MDFIQIRDIFYSIDDVNHQIIVKGRAEGLVKCIEVIQRECQSGQVTVRDDLAEEIEQMRRYEMGELIGYDLYGELSASQLTFGQLHRVKLGVDVFRDYGDEALFFLYFANDLPNDDHALSFLRVKSVFEAVLENNY